MVECAISTILSVTLLGNRPFMSTLRRFWKKHNFLILLSVMFTPVKFPKFAMNGITLRSYEFIAVKKKIILHNLQSAAFSIVAAIVKNSLLLSRYSHHLTVDPLFTVGWSPDWRKTHKSCSSFCTLFVKSYLF